MRRTESLKQQTPIRILRDEYLSEIKQEWERHGYDPNYLLDENDNFYNVLEDFYKSKDELKAMSHWNAYINNYCFQRSDDVRIYKLLFDLARNSLCGFFNVKKRRYFRESEIYPYAEWYLDLIDRGKYFYLGRYNDKDKDSFGYIERENEFNELCNKYSAIFSNIGALLIAIDLTQYLDEKKICDKRITKSNVDKFLRYGPQAGYIFDPELMEYRKPKNFKEFAYDLHTRYWFRDPSKGYHIEAPYKWDPDIPTPEQLTE